MAALTTGTLRKGSVTYQGRSVLRPQIPSGSPSHPDVPLSHAPNLVAGRTLYSKSF